MGQTHLVVDGSNIATEGRSLPSLQQLLDAVDAVRKENNYSNVTVIVDATFGHRIDEAERPEFDKGIDSGEIITPPAGVIGRGDAFILEVADRVDAVVLSNDSFQEFHGTYTWLFDEGRLLGGKHVPGVGWIFLARSPVRGPTSRRAVSEAKRKRRVSTQRATGPKKKAASKKSAPAQKKAREKPSDSGRKRGGKEPEPYNEPLPFIEFVGAHPVGSVIEAEIEQFSSHGAYVVCDGTRCYISLKAISDPPPRSAREVFTIGETRSFVVDAIDTPRRGIDLRMPDAEPSESAPGKPARAPSKPAKAAKPARRKAAAEKPARRKSEAEEPAAAETPVPEKPAPAETPEKAKEVVSGAEAEKMSVSQRRKLRARQEAEAAEHAASEAAATEKAAAPKRAATKKAAGTKKAADKKASAKKAAAKKRSATKKAAAKKATAKKAAAKKAATKKAAGTKKTAAKKTAAKKKAATKKRSTTKKAAAKKTTAKKRPAKRSGTNKTGGSDQS